MELFYVLQAVVYGNAAILLCCEVPEMFCFDHETSSNFSLALG